MREDVTYLMSSLIAWDLSVVYVISFLIGSELENKASIDVLVFSPVLNDS